MNPKNRKLLIIGLVIIILVCIGIVCVSAAGIAGFSLYKRQGNVIEPPMEEFPVNPPVEEVPSLVPTAPVVAFPGGTMTFQDPEGFYSLSYPGTWIVQTAGSQQQFCTDESAATCFSIGVHLKALDARQLTDEMRAAFPDFVDSYQELSVQELSISGLPGFIVEQSYTWSGMAQTGFSVYTVQNRTGYELMGWTLTDEPPETLDILRTMLAEFTLHTHAAAPPYSAWASHQSAHLTFYYQPDSWIAGDISTIADDHEWAYDEIIQDLQISYNDRISFYLYPSKEALYRATHRQYGFAINEGREVHSMWQSQENHQSLGHEMTHVLTYWALGNPAHALLGEGVAVCMDHSGKDYQSLAYDLYNQGLWVPLRDLVGDPWFEVDAEIAYPESGAFFCHLLDRYNLDGVKSLYTQINLEQGLNDLLGVSFDWVEQDFLMWIQE